MVLSLSGISPNFRRAAPILDKWPSVLAFQAVNWGVAGSAHSGRPNLWPSPHILLCTPKPTLTHPLGLTYTLQGPKRAYQALRLAQAFCPLSNSHPPCISLYSPTIPLSIAQHQHIHLSIFSINPNILSVSKTFVIHPSALLLLLLCLQMSQFNHLLLSILYITYF